MAEEWNRDLYILFGTPCPRSNIQRTLEIARLDAGYDVLALLAVGAHSVLRQLAFVTGEPAETIARLRDWIQETSLRGIFDGTEDPGSVTGPLLGILGQLPVDLQAVHLHSHGLADRGEALGIVLIGMGGERRAVDPNWTRELHLRVNATIYADIRRDHVATRRVLVESRLHLPDRAESASAATSASGTYATSVDGLLQLICNITRADGAIYYRLDGPTSALQWQAHHLRAAAAPGEQRDPLLPVVPEVMPSSVPVTDDGGGERTISGFLVETLRTASMMFAPSEASPVAGSPEVEVIAAGVPSIALTRESLNQGVIAVWSIDRSAKRFDRAQLGWLRNIALRVALLERSSEAEESAGQMATLGRSLTSPSPRNELRGAEVLRGMPVPEDLRNVLPHWQELVTRLRAATQSSSVTIRILRARTAADAVELVLHRFASAPNPPNIERSEEIRVTGMRLLRPEDQEAVPSWQTSLNAYVAHTGQPHYLFDTERPPNQQGAAELRDFIQVGGRPPARSTICVPIAVNGCLVGTMNLESPFPDAYAHVRQAVESYAAFAGVSLAMVRQELGNEVSVRAAAYGLTAHDRLHFEEELARAQAELTRLGSSFELQEIETPDPPSEQDAAATEATSFLSLLDEVQDKRRRRGRPTPRLQIGDRLDHIRIPRHNRDRYARILDELLGNAAIYEAGPPNAPPTVSFRGTVEVGGRRYRAIAFSNVPRSPPAAGPLCRLYAGSYIVDDDRPHLGCYLVGQIVRELRGIIAVDHLRDAPLDPGRFETLVLLPE